MEKSGFSMDQRTEESVLAWFRLIGGNLGCNLASLADLKSGTFFIDILVEIDPLYFSKTKKRILQYVEDSRILILKNLKTLAEEIGRYFSEVLKIEISSQRKEVFSFSNENDISLLINLLELVIYVIIVASQSHPDKYIQPMMRMDEDCQHSLMCLIKRLQEEFLPEVPVSGSEMDSFIKKEKRLLEKLDELEVENLDLNNKLSEMRVTMSLFDKKQAEMGEIIAAKNAVIRGLEKEKEKLNNQIEINSMDSLQKTVELKEVKITEMGKYIEELTIGYEKRISALEEELSQERAHRSKIAKLEQSLEYYKSKCGDVHRLTEQNSDFRLQNDRLRQQLDELQKHHDLNELKVAKYVEKLDEIQLEKLNLELEISKNNSELLRIKQEVSEMSEKSFKKDQKIADLQQKLDFEPQRTESSPRSLKKELQGLVAEVQGGDSQGLGSSLELLRDEIRQREKENRLLMEKCKELQNENSELQRALKNTVGELKKENKRLLGEVARKNEEKEALEERMEGWKELEEENQSLRETVSEKQEQIRDLYEKNNALERTNRRSNVAKNQEAQQKKELEGLKEYISGMELRYRKTMEKKTEEVELLVSALYTLRAETVGFSKPQKVLQDLKNNVFK